MKAKTKTNKISLRLKQEEYDYLQEIANSFSISLSEAVRFAITATYLNGLPDDEQSKEMKMTIDSVFNQIRIQEKKIMYLENLVYGQITDLKKSMKEVEKMDEALIKSMKQQMTISSVSD